MVEQLELENQQTPKQEGQESERKKSGRFKLS
jgi:hypothetical protein